MKSIQITYEDLMGSILLFSKKEEKKHIITILRPDFNSWHKIPGVKPNWSPDKIEIDKDANTFKVWRIADKEPSVLVTHIFHDEQGFCEVRGLEKQDLSHIEQVATKKEPKTKAAKATKTEKSSTSDPDLFG